MRRNGFVAVALALPLLLAACGGGSDSSSDSSSGGGASVKPNEVAVKIVDLGCDPATLALPAGPTVFKVQNDGASKVSEFEVLDGDRILGEAENIAPGLSGEFSVTLSAGEYTTYCPGGTSQERGTLKVTGESGPGTASASAAAAVAAYRTYVEQQTKLLAEDSAKFIDAVKAGDVAKAKELYAPARIPYERIEPVAESFGNLDPKIDARAGDVPAAQWTGFHPIEQALWQKGTLAGTEKLADGLSTDIADLETRVKTVQLEPAQIANGAVELLGEVSKSKITGEEERYSHIDLVDFQANVEGSHAAFNALRPLVAESDPDLADTIDRRFDAVMTSLKPYQRGDGYVSYTELTESDTRKLSQAIDALAEPLSQVGRIVVSGLRGHHDHHVGMSEGPRFSRRKLLLGAGAAGGALALGGLGIERLTDDGDEAGSSETIPFYGEHQAGIATPAQDRLHFAAFDLVTDSRQDLSDLLRTWTEAAARMTVGLPAGPDNDDPNAPPDDTGEAVGLPPARLTVTFGLGPSVFEQDGKDRFGLASRRPEALHDLPAFGDDALDPAMSGGDLCIQACADDPQVAFHAVRNLARLGRGGVVMRWSQLGFGRTSSTSRAQDTPRNLMGFKDGTNNIKLEDHAGLAEHVWVPDTSQPAWFAGGTYLVARRIRMLIEVWDRTTLLDQEQTIGRVKVSGAPLGETKEFDTVNLTAKDPSGLPVIPIDSHIRLAAPAENSGTNILRRGYSFTDGMDERLGQLDAGLFFLGFMHDPQAFITLQTKLGQNDALNEYISHRGSALFAVPPGASQGGFVGDRLFA